MGSEIRKTVAVNCHNQFLSTARQQVQSEEEGDVKKETLQFLF
jgi:hypothetical protein